MTFPEFMPNLRHGIGATPKDGGCLIQVAGWVFDGKSWTDDTPCVHPVLRRVGINVNDAVSDAARQSLLRLVPRLIGTGLTGNGVEDRRVSVALASFAETHAKRSAGKAKTAVTVAAADAARDAARAAYAVAAYASYAGYVYASYAFAGDAAYAYAGDAAAAAVTGAALAAAAGVAGGAGAKQKARDEARIRFLTELIDEYDRLTGRETTGATVPDETWHRLHTAMTTNT